MSEPRTPRCADCGFITLRNRNTGQLDEVDSDFRETGNPPHLKMPVVGGAAMKFALVDMTPYRHQPVCFARAVNLGAERPGTPEVLASHPDWSSESMLEVLTKPRPDCAGSAFTSAFTKWQQGFTPKEHREMRDREEKLDREEGSRSGAEGRAESRDADQRQWQEAMTKAAEERDDARHWREMWIIGVAVTLAIALSTILGAAIEAEWIPKPW